MNADESAGPLLLIYEECFCRLLKSMQQLNKAVLKEEREPVRY